MAVFMINICKYNGCGITFPRLADLIEHIEDVHIDLDPAVVEQKESSQPACIPLSYVLKFFTEATRREFQSMPPAPDVRRRLPSAPKTPSVRSSTPTGSEMDEDEMMSPSEDSNDSWTTVEEYSSDYILRYGVKLNGSAGAAPALGHRGGAGAAGAGAGAGVGAGPGGPLDKPFACPVPGCSKRYKNINGIKYHSKNGHKKDGKIKKAYKCQCGKSYKSAQGLKSHTVTQHIASSAPPPPRALASLVVTAAPAAPRALHLDPIDNKLVRIYDTIQAKDLSTFTIPKHSVSTVSISPRQSAPAPAPAPAQAAPRVTVHPAHPVTYNNQTH